MPLFRAIYSQKSSNFARNSIRKGHEVSEGTKCLSASRKNRLTTSKKCT